MREYGEGMGLLVRGPGGGLTQVQACSGKEVSRCAIGNGSWPAAEGANEPPK